MKIKKTLRGGSIGLFFKSINCLLIALFCLSYPAMANSIQTSVALPVGMAHTTANSSITGIVQPVHHSNNVGPNNGLIHNLSSLQVIHQANFVSSGSPLNSTSLTTTTISATLQNIISNAINTNSKSVPQQLTTVLPSSPPILKVVGIFQLPPPILLKVVGIFLLSPGTNNSQPLSGGGNNRQNTNLQFAAPPTQPEFNTSLFNSNTILATDVTRSNQFQVVTPPTVCPPLTILSAESSTPWLVASNSCQPFSFEDEDGTVVIGSAGTVFAPDAPHTILLREGKMVIMSGEHGVLLKTAQGNLEIPPGSSIIVQQTELGIVRIANLAGEQVILTVVKDNQAHTLISNPGEEVLVANAALAREELTAAGTVGGKIIPYDSTIAELQIEKRQFNAQTAAEQEPLMQCNTTCFTPSAKQKFTAVKRNLGVVSQSLPGNNGLLRKASRANQYTSEFIPTSYIENTKPMANLPSVGGGISTIATDSAIIKRINESQITLEGAGMVNLRQGEALVCTDKPTVVKTLKYLISIPAGTIALISQDRNTIKVHNLYSKANNSIQINTGAGVDSSLSVGQEALVSSNVNELLNQLKAEPIGRRNIQGFDLANGHSLVRCEVSPISLMQNTYILNKLMKSKNKDDQAIAKQLLRMAAVLSQATSSHGAYATIQNVNEERVASKASPNAH